MDISKSSLYVLLDELSKLNYIHKDEHGYYKLWIKLISIGDAAKQSRNFHTVVKKNLEDLVVNTGCLAAYFGIVSGENAYYMIKASNKASSIETKSKESMPIDFLHSGIGKCILAFLPSNIQNNIISTLDFNKITHKSITSAEILKNDLQKTVRRGWAFNDGEDDPEIRSIGVPVLDDNNSLIGAVSIVGTVNRMNDDNLEKLADLTKSVVKTIYKGISSD